MKSWKVRLLTASYTKEGDVVLELFGRTDKNKSITIRYEGFKPYFFLVEPSSGVISGLKADETVISVEDIELYHGGALHRCSRVTIKYPWMVPEYRKKYGTSTRVLAADIPFHHRFIYDFDLASCVRVYGEELNNQNYTTDIVVRAEKFENIEPFKPPLKILSFDIENSIQTNEILTICCAMSSGKRITRKSIVSDEKSMILDFIALIKDQDPDVITGYNIDGYDIPLILERAAHHRIPSLDIGRNGNEPRQVSNRFWRLHGRIIADAWWNAKRELRPKQETLNAVAKLVLGEEKDDVNPAMIDQEWAQDPDKVVKSHKESEQ